ncbi:MAG TPA: hypothetical protein VJ044_17440, partial [Candidatus Hodarchaeales archaeon]|nr:hypothetical protein [Candidatus Hodarchaeales archaeon]
MSTFATDTPSAQASYKDAWAAIFNSLQFSAAIYNAAIFALYTVNSRDLALWATNSFWYYNLLKSFHETFDWKRFLSDPDLIYFRVRAMQTSFQSLHTLAFTLSRKIGTNRFLDIGTHGLFSFDGDHLPALRDLNNDLRQMTAAAVFKLQELYLQGLIDVNNPPKGSPHVEALYQLLRNTELDEAYYNALSIALEPQNPILSNHWVIHALDLALHHARVSADYWINRAGGKQLVLKSGAGDGLCSIVENIIELLVLKAKWIGSIEVYFQGIQEYDWVFVDAEVSDYPSVFVTQIVAETYLVCHFSVEDRFSHVLTTLNTVKHGIINRSRDIVALTVLESLLGFLVGAATPEIVQE